ncbi:hypothetical protein FOFC_17277 [Fusarium oxysporum]|nr:hypothetical protein FOFC_17277 [Fusarium oxysporum]
MSRDNKESRIILALQALHKDPKLRPRRAAEIYNVHYRTLYRRQKGTQSRSDCIPKSRRLSNLEEQVIVEHILDLDSRGCPPRLRDVEEIANQLLADRQAQPVSKNWASNYIKRQPELKTRFQRRYDYQRARCEDPIVIRNWFRLVQNTIAKYGTRSDDIYNFDETGFAMGMIGSGPGNREWVTVIQAINAEGWAVQPFIVFAGQNHLANWYRESNLPGDWVITTTQNGWTDNQTGLGWLKHFDRCTANRSVGSYRLLILDGHESHQSFNFERYCKQNNIIPLYMPPPSSHLLQPLDVGCFGPLKKAYGREIEHLIRRSITHVSKTEFLPAFYAASQATMTEKNIKGGFKGAGLVPLDPESVISKLDVQLRTPTPAEEVAESSTPWVSKTPKTIIEIETFSEKLKVGIKRHKDSSPESIIAAVTTFEKGSKYNRVNLVIKGTENQDLREANTVLSHCRRAKRTRLQNGGPLTIKDGQGLIDQIEVDTQVVAVSSRSDGRGRSARPGVRHCGVCGKTGHNVRTCLVVTEISGEEDSNLF